ncbi:DExH-box splicing factor binding site-domain-containing protein [Xylaria bambusicola]|uniref:DExH-box splicing factor binding site-domain-containing protein n=1 Tax=Xylaria bambusicola TaxID=326684 RepID=UPI002008E4BA|nr:DExH-box splicing factor binding site-domain-containing protein [Xylaria bambusicola]KAI0526463.1 DExH-box splicing factor binding site-domain-containing protein [Xylaria bambusicola]
MSESAPQQQAPRIAIKFGASSSVAPKPSSTAAIRRGQAQLSSTLGKRQRPNALHHESDSGDEDDILGKLEAVTTFNADTSSRSSDVHSDKRKKDEYVIRSQKNRDWKAEMKSIRKNPPTIQSLSTENHSLEIAPADQDKDVKWGLNITKQSVKESLEDSSTAEKAPEEQVKSSSNKPPILTESPEDAEKDAMDALLGKRKPTRNLVINDSATNSRPQFSEQDAYQKRIMEAAEVSTIEEYSEIPEGEFGAAMLRGMGWKGEEFGSKPKEVQRRPHLMGLGSKEDEEIKKAELAKRHGHRERRPRLDEYKRAREKEKQERNGRYRESYKTERERERRDHGYEYPQRARHRDLHDRGRR